MDLQVLNMQPQQLSTRGQSCFIYTPVQSSCSLDYFGEKSIHYIIFIPKMLSTESAVENP